MKQKNKLKRKFVQNNNEIKYKIDFCPLVTLIVTIVCVILYSIFNIIGKDIESSGCILFILAEDVIVLLSSLYFIIVNKNKGNIYIEYENMLLPIGSMLICITICFFDINMINNFFAISFVIIYIIILLVVIVELYGNSFIDKLGVNNIAVIVEIDLLLYFMFLSGVIKSVNSVALFLFSLLFALIMYINTAHNRTNNFFYIILKVIFALFVLFCFNKVIYIFSIYLVKIKDDILIFFQKYFIGLKYKVTTAKMFLMMVLYYASSYIVYQALMENYYDEKYYNKNHVVFAKFNELNNILLMLCVFIFMTIFDFSEYSDGYIVNDYLLSITLITLWILFIDKRKNIINIYDDDNDILFLKKEF